MDNGESQCIAFGGLRVDDAIEEALLRVVGPGAITAATDAAKQASRLRDGAPRCWAETSKQRAMPPTVPSDNTMPPTPPIGW